MEAEVRTQARGIWRSILHALGVIAALIWLVVAVTGILLTYHFDINDRLISAKAPPKDFAAIERTMDRLEAAGGAAKVNWIWSTAGMRDRFLMNYTAPDGEVRAARLAGDGTVLLDTSFSEHTFLEWVREIHLTLAGGKTGEWVLTIAGLALLANLVIGAVQALRRSGQFAPGAPLANDRLLSWYRTFGLVGVVPTFIVVLAAVVIFFEHSIEGPIGAPPRSLPAIAPQGKGAGFAAVARAAEAAIPNGRFVGTAMSKEDDATFMVSVNVPGEYFRDDGYAGSVVAINGNDASVREVYELSKASAAYKAIALPYPVHTGEIAGPIGRFIVMLTGVWLAAMTIIGLILWNRRRKLAAA